MIPYLIPTKDFVKLVSNISFTKGDSIYDAFHKYNGTLNYEEWTYRKIVKYSDFLNKKPLLKYFIACDDNGDPMEEPIRTDEIDVDESEGIDTGFLESQCKYIQAKQNLIFEGWTYVKGGNGKVSGINKFMPNMDCQNKNIFIPLKMFNKLHYEFYYDSIESLLTIIHDRNLNGLTDIDNLFKFTKKESNKFFKNMIKLYSNNCDTSNLQVCSCGIYAHGELETFLGFDILTTEYLEWVDRAGFKLPPIFKTGIHDVVVIDGNNQINATMFYWSLSEFTHKGLVVLKTDVSANEEAFKKYISKETKI